jgi:hypothetical protein
MALPAGGSCDDADFLAQRTLAGVVGFLKIELGLQPDEQVSGDATSGSLLRYPWQASRPTRPPA